ncbi:uncharacterized protein LOC144883690 [Branchiostoma floridae x Branchiostoma japonicum]
MSGIRRNVVWNDGCKYDYSNIPKKKRRSGNSSASTNSTSTRREGSSKIPDSEINQLQDAPDQSMVSSLSDSQVSVEAPAAVQASYPLDNFTSYVTQLRQQSAITMCDPLATVFALPDFNNHSLKLTVNKYHIVERCSKTVEHACEWFYCCSCSRREQDLVMSLSSVIVGGVSRIRDNYCIHIKAVIQIVNDIDVQYNLQPGLKEDDHSYTIPSGFADLDSLVEQTDAVFKVYGDGIFCSKSDCDFNSYGILCCGKGIKCMTCSQGCQSCSHVKQLKTLLSNEHEIYSQTLQDTLQSVQAILGDSSVSQSGSSPVCVSEKRIQFNVLPGQFKNTAGYNPHQFCQDDSTVTLVSCESCPTCGSELPGGDTATETVSWPCSHPPLVTRNFVFKTKVYQRPCSSCDTNLPFDGGADGILNMGTFLISHEVLRDYMYHFLQTGMTMFGYYQTLSKHMEDAGVAGFQQVLSYNKFRQSWYEFEELLDIDYSKGFMCPLCGPAPKVIICDGTALSFRRELLPWQQVLGESDSGTETAYPGSSHRDRVFSSQQPTRNARLCHHRLPLSSNSNQHLKTCPEGLKSLLGTLSKNSPVCGLFHPSEELHDFVQKVADGAAISDSVCDMEFLQKHIPVLFDHVRNGDGSCVAEELRPLLLALLDVAEKPFNQNARVPDDCAGQRGVNPDLISFFPALGHVRSRGKYTADRGRNDVKGCSKSSSGHPSLLPGMFLLNCGHGINYGFEVMVKHESPNTPFTILRTRFKDVPETVIYDNSCNLHSYCLNRDPLLFKNTWFLVDRLHWKNHKGCSVGYQLSRYPQYDNVNSQVVEQCNSALKKLKGQLSYMNPANFMRQAKLFLWYKNQAVIKRM